MDNKKQRPTVMRRKSRSETRLIWCYFYFKQKGFIATVALHNIRTTSEEGFRFALTQSTLDRRGWDLLPLNEPRSFTSWNTSLIELRFCHCVCRVRCLSYEMRFEIRDWVLRWRRINYSNVTVARPETAFDSSRTVWCSMEKNHSSEVLIKSRRKIRNHETMRFSLRRRSFRVELDSSSSSPRCSHSPSVCIGKRFIAIRVIYLLRWAITNTLCNQSMARYVKCA